MRAFRAWVLVAVTILAAGCSGAGAKGDGRPLTTAPSATVSADMGSVSGAVVDEEARPIVGADVALTGSSLPQTRSDTHGRFTFNGVAPGSYAVIAQSLGYEAATRRVDVRAGEVTDVNLALVALSVESPYHLSDERAGRLGCGVYGVAVWQHCPSASAFFDHRPCVQLNVTNGNTWRQAELVWQGNGAQAPTTLWLGERNSAGNGWNDYAQGSSPVVVQTEKGLTIKKGAGISQWCVHTASAVTPAVAIDQPFTVYFTAFYHMDEIPADFAARPQ